MYIINVGILTKEGGKRYRENIICVSNVDAFGCTKYSLHIQVMEWQSFFFHLPFLPLSGSAAAVSALPPCYYLYVLHLSPASSSTLKSLWLVPERGVILQILHPYQLCTNANLLSGSGIRHRETNIVRLIRYWCLSACLLAL